MLERLGETKRLWRASRKTRKTRRFSGHCSLCSIPRFTRSFLCGFLWFFVVSLAVFFLLSWSFGVVCHATFAPCSCCCSLVHGRSPMETMRRQADASCSRVAAPRRRLVRRVLFRLREQPNHQNTRICWGQPYLAIVLAHVFLAIFGACTALPPKPSVERRVQFWRIFGHFFSLSLPRILCRAALQRSMPLTMTRHCCD